MIDAGYFPKQITPMPEWQATMGVVEVCSVSNHIAKPPGGWIERWLHNDFGWFNRECDALAVVPAGQRGTYRLYAYRILPAFFRHGSRQAFVLPANVHPDPVPESFRSLGYDSVSKSIEPGFTFECSPLSCNLLATEIKANACCLFDSLADAVAGAVRFSIEQPEPGDYYVGEVLERPWTSEDERPPRR